MRTDLKVVSSVVAVVATTVVVYVALVFLHGLKRKFTGSSRKSLKIKYVKYI